MSKSIIWELVKINILYSNPQLLASVKKKQSKRKDASFSAYKSVLLQQVFMVLSVGLLYSVFFMGVDYSQSIGFFSLQLALFTIIAIVYGFTGFFSVFYDSKDTKLYLALPLKPQEVFLAKILSAQGMVLPFLMPCLSLLLITYWQIGGPLLALASIPSFLILWILANLVNLIIMHFVGEVLTKSPRKTLISTILMTGSSLLAFAALMFLQSQQTVSLESGGFVDFPIIPIFAGFHYLVSHTISLETLLHFGLPFILMIGLIVFAFKTVIPNYFNQVLAIENASTKRTNNAKSAKIPSNLNQALVKHHLSTLKDSNLMVQTMIQPIIMGVALFPSFSRFTENSGLSSVGWDFFGIALLAGFLLGSLFAGSTTFIGVAMSLEKENYHFIRTLPISFKKFIIQKFWVLAAVQFALPTLLYFALALGFMKVKLILAVFFTVGIIISALLTGQIYYWRDQRLLVLNWQNSNQLFGRGAGQWLIAGSIIGTMFLGAIILVVSIILAGTIGAAYVSSALMTLLFVLSAALQLYIYKAYWQKLK
ncbi:permease [Streptococcus suis]|uniref:permease n=1 Tax=Streptococcus suis TaxID=1307 RepID=UPI0011466433|nr:permease [Streptococcus suis]TQE46530.1 permease [Streptococcus suis]